MRLELRTSRVVKVLQWTAIAVFVPSVLLLTGELLAQAPNSTQGGPAPAADAPASREARMSVLRKKILRDEDFIESESNRDPFRSYLGLFVDKRPIQVRNVPAIFDKFALEELTLIAVISGTETPLAMFRDPGGLGQTIRRGDYVSKSAARVSKILADRVILEMTEVMGTGEQRALEKAVLVNPEAPQQ